MVLTNRVSVRSPAFFIVGNTRTQIVRFTVDRYIDGVDLSVLAWGIHIKNAEGAQDVAAPHVQPTIKSDKIVIEWLVQGIATVVEGDVTFSLRGVASDVDGMPIRWSSNDMKRPVYSAQESAPTSDQENMLTQLDALIEYVGNELPRLLEEVHDATHNVPYIGDNGNWYVWDSESNVYVDSGKPSQGTSSGGGSGGIINETDPTVPAWAKKPNKPEYTAEEVGAQPKGDYALRSDIPTVPVQSVNGKTGEIELTAHDVGAASAEDVSRFSEEVKTVQDNIDNLGGTVEITSGSPEKSKTALVVDPNANSINLYTAEEVDAIIKKLSEEVYDATHNVPYINENGNWFIWDTEAGAYIDSGKPSQGSSGGSSGGLIVDAEGNATFSGTSLVVDNDGNATIGG